jgi:translation initiation factor RLI1
MGMIGSGLDDVAGERGKLDRVEERQPRDCRLRSIALTLGANADLHLIDEPSAFLDAEQGVVIVKIIKRLSATS